MRCVHGAKTQNGEEFVNKKNETSTFKKWFQFVEYFLFAHTLMQYETSEYERVKRGNVRQKANNLWINEKCVKEVKIWKRGRTVRMWQIWK